MEAYPVYLLIVGGFAALYWASGSLTNANWRVWAGFSVLAACMTGFLWVVSEPQNFLSDFNKAYYKAGSLVHEDPDALYVTDPAEFVNVPIVGFLFTPLAALPRGVAGGIVTVLGLGAIAAAFALLVMLAQLSIQRAAVLGGLFVINGPLMNSFREGNATHFVLFGLAAALACIVRWKLPVVAGLVLSLCVLLKPPLAILGVGLLVHRQLSVIITLAGVFAVVAVTSLAVFGWDLHVTWYERIVEPFQQHPLGAFNVQSADGFLARLLVGGEHLQDWTAIDDIPGAFGPARTVIVGLLLASVVATWWVSRQSKAEGLIYLDMCVLIVLSIVMGPITWTHYYALMLIPFAFMLGGQISVPEGRLAMGYLTAAVLLVSAPVVQVAPEVSPLDELVPRLFISHYFYGGLMILGALLIARVRSVEPAAAIESTKPDGAGQVVATTT